MIAPTINEYIWNVLCLDDTFSQKYDVYRSKLGDSFLPFFPVFDNLAGDSSWGSEPYVLYDSLRPRPDRNTPKEIKEQIVYTLVGKITDIFALKDSIVDTFDQWDFQPFSIDGFKINSITVYQTERTRGRDSVRQTYSLTLIVEVYYLEC